MKADVVVLGAGIVGTSVAVHLALRGRSVVLVDRRAPGEETSYGNSGVVGRSGIYPAAFPRSLTALMRVARQRYPGARYHPAALPWLAPWLFAYWRASAPERLEHAARVLAPLNAAAIEEHGRIAALADAGHFYRDGGWLKVYRSEAGFDAARALIAIAAEHGLGVVAMGREETLSAEPHLKPAFAGSALWTDLRSVSSPGGVVKAFAKALPGLGAMVVTGDARSLRTEADGAWSVAGEDGERIAAREAVIALGPWSAAILRPLGYRLPLAVKRGYHMHFATEGNATLNRPVLDEERGYVIAPMENGIRLTTGSEFASLEAAKTPVQLDIAEHDARELFPLAGRREAEPWMGARPCLPDMLPVIGPAPRHKGLWLAFGHQHSGFTLGPPTGRLIAEMITGEVPFVDPAPFAADRF
ncbi:MAG TPA: FAD-binding oxidoreductase [Bauldia sp.]|nr:FAD-binding oxidoreductase [Bauldia sp.]